MLAIKQFFPSLHLILLSLILVNSLVDVLAAALDVGIDGVLVGSMVGFLHVVLVVVLIALKIGTAQARQLCTLAVCLAAVFMDTGCRRFETRCQLLVKCVRPSSKELNITVGDVLRHIGVC